MKLLLSFLFLCAGFVADAQVRRIGVLGSSTANGQGVPFDSSWVQKMRFYYRERALIDTVHKIAASTFDCYSGMPTGYVPPPGRNTPNTSYNITRLMSRTPIPTTVIINYPTTNFDTFSDQEILFCLDSIRKYAMSFGAVCYIATTQPRDNFSDAGRARLKYLNDLIKNYFGHYAIDFFNVLNNATNNKIKPEYALGDGIHVNSRGHEVLFRQVLQKNIFNIDTTSVRRVLIDIGATTSGTDQWGKRWNAMADARRGVQVNNAVTTNNQLTGIGIEVVNPLSNATVTDKGLGTSSDVGNVSEYPSFATSDHAIATSSVTNGQWRVYGLESAKTYHIRFWGSQLLSGYRILQVKRSDESVWQEFNAGMNKNYINAVTFAVTGKTAVSFDFRVKSGSVGGHVSIIDIVSTASNAVPPVNQPPLVFAGADTSITLPAGIQLRGSGSDPDGTITSYTWRKIAGPTAFQISDPSVAQPLLSGLAAGTYQLELRVTDDDGSSSADTVHVTVKPAVTTVTQQRILIDLGLANATSNGADQWGKYWNNVTDARPGIRLTNAINTANQPTNIQFEVVRQTGSTAGYDLNTRTSNTIGTIGDYPASATNDNAFAHTSITDGEWRFSGLDPAKTYTIKFWGSITGSGSRILQVKPSYETVWKEYNASANLNFDNAAIFTITGMTDVSFNIRVKSGSTFSYINVIDIKVDALLQSPPVADAGSEINVQLPLDSTRLNGSGSYHPGGSAISYRWRKISGPSNYTLTDSTSSRPLVRNLVAGMYKFELMVSDTDGLTAKDTVTVNVNSPSVNIAPVANAGSDKTIRLPVNSAILDGINSTDPDGGSLSYSWRQLSGPGSATIVGANNPSATVQGLISGNYVFELLVTDAQAATDRDTVGVLVQPAFIPPVAKAGPDIQITLPVNKAVLDGRSSVDQDGSIISYQWQKLNGPGGGTIVNPNINLTEANNLAQGVYAFLLTVTDNDGLTHRDTLVVTVNQAINRPPSANAGNDLSIVFPAGATLNGSASDPDGGTLVYTWSQVSGPSVATIAAPSVLNTTVSDLLQGVYYFSLSVTDNGGLSNSDTMKVTVNAPVPVPNQRVLIDAGLAASQTASPDASGKYWNNVTDARPGVRVANAISTSGQQTGIKFEVINPAGASAAYDLNTRTSNDVGPVGDYPATATNDNALVHSSVTNGMWKLSGLDPASTYTVKFWGSIAMTGTRVVQLKPAHETVWQEFNSSMNRNYTTAANFVITGRTEVSFDIRVKQGSSYGYINVIDINVQNSGATTSASAGRSIGSQSTVSVSPDVQTLDSLARLNPAIQTLVAPNPTPGNINIRMNNSYLGPLEMQLADVNGRQTKSWIDNKTNIIYHETLQLGDQPAGVYFLIIKMRGKTEVIRIVKR